MGKKIAFYSISFLLIISAFLGGWYLASRNLKSIELETTLQLKPGEEEGNFFNAGIISIDDTKKPAEITARVSLARFSNPPAPTVVQIILVDEKTEITMGELWQNQPLKSISLSELRINDGLVVFVQEPISGLFKRGVYSATKINKVVQENEVIIYGATSSQDEIILSQFEIKYGTLRMVTIPSMVTAKIISVNPTKSEIVANIDFIAAGFINPPSDTTKTILVSVNTAIIEGGYGAAANTKPITLSQLQAGDNILIVLLAEEFISDIFSREYYTAVIIKRIIK